MAGSKRTSKRGNGAGSLFQRAEGGPWYASWYNGEGKRKERSTRTTSRADAERIMRKWVERAALEREGLVKPEGGTELDRHAAATIASHLEAFERSKLAEGRTAKHVEGTAAMIGATAAECGWQSLGDVNPERLERLVSSRQASERGGWTPRTAAKCIAAWRTFMRWCVRDARLEADPLARLKKPAPHRQRERRYLSVDEWRWLRASTDRAPDRFGMTGPDRALLYAVAIETGLRAGELATLTRAHLALDGAQPHILLHAAETKNRRAARQYLRRSLADTLAAHTARTMPGGPVFNMPPSTRTSAMIRADLRDARAAWIAEVGDDARGRIERERSDFLAAEDHDGRHLDFHALRHTTGAWAAIGGASPKAIQTLMRHSTITLTLDTYGHLLPDEAASTVARMPDVEPIALRLTGTGDEPKDREHLPDSIPATIPATRVRVWATHGDCVRDVQLNTTAEPAVASNEWARRDSNPHPGFPEADFKSAASASSATGPWGMLVIEAQSRRSRSVTSWIRARASDSGAGLWEQAPAEEFAVRAARARGPRPRERHGFGPRVSVLDDVAPVLVADVSGNTRIHRECPEVDASHDRSHAWYTSCPQLHGRGDGSPSVVADGQDLLACCGSNLLDPVLDLVERDVDRVRHGHGVSFLLRAAIDDDRAP